MAIVIITILNTTWLKIFDIRKDTNGNKDPNHKSSSHRYKANKIEEIIGIILSVHIYSKIFIL